MKSITVKAPAKVNLVLKVLGKRKDGYHDLHTLFECISLFDTITISKKPSGITLASDKFITRDPKDNLIYKAAELILNEGKIKGGVKIDIKKRIPIAAGLGGGSSDAASTLIGINKLYNIGLGQKQLVKLAKKLGADVPFFILETPFAIGTGRGDLLKPLKWEKSLWNVVIYPGFKLATRDVFEAFDKAPKSLTRKGADVRIPRSFKDFDSLERMIHNDLEATAISKKKVLGKIIERLATSIGTKAIVSGSGPSVFCLCRTRKEAVSAKRRLIGGLPGSSRHVVFTARTYLT